MSNAAITLQFGMDSLEVPAAIPADVSAILSSNYVRSRWANLGDNVVAEIHGAPATVAEPGDTVVIRQKANTKG